jgi:hypothetical protein
MSSNNEIEIPANSRLSQVGAEILAEQSRKALTDDAYKLPPKLNLNIDPPFSAKPDDNQVQYRVGPYAPGYEPDKQPPFDPGAESQRNMLYGPQGYVDGRRRYSGNDYGNPGQQDGADQAFKDRLADSIYPGLGRFEGQGDHNSWRLDYGDPGRCKTRASVGVCFKLDFH